MSEVDDRIRGWLDAIEEPYTVPIEAGKFVAAEQEQHLDEFNAWLVEHAAVFVAWRMGSLNRSDRAIALGRQKSRVFGKAVEAAERGDLAPLRSIYEAPYTVDGMNYKLGQMVHSTVEPAAVECEERSVSNAFEGAFLRALGKKLPKDDSKTVADVFTEDQLTSLRRRLTA